MAEASVSLCHPAEPPVNITCQQTQRMKHVRREDNSLPNDSPYSHPVYKQVSLANGIINKMKKDEIKQKLAEYHLDTRGHKDVLKKRLKNYLKNSKLTQAHVRKRSEPLYDYYIVIDFEATCDEYNPEGFQHEIIEFPVVLINAHTVTKVDEFHSYVRPVINPNLTAFCTKLTGITQREVSGSETFTDVLRRMLAWMESHRLGSAHTFALVTDGPWDMSRFMFQQCQWSEITMPNWSCRWVNLRKAFCNFYRLRRAKLITMLENLGMTFEGHQHSGLDDTRNIARIVARMLEDGAELQLNEELFHDKRHKNQAVVCPLKKSDFLNSDSDGDLGEKALDTDISNTISGMESLNMTELTSGNMAAPETHGPYDDLLTYYALQKS